MVDAMNQEHPVIRSKESEPVVRALRDRLRGEVLADAVSIGIYSTDASMYQIPPVAVVLPVDRADAIRALRTAAEFSCPVVGRGGGTSLTGQSIGPAVVIDFSKYMNSLLEVNEQERWARVEPGIVRDELNRRIAETGLFYAVDPATSSRANVGAIVVNNSAGMRSVRYGMAIDHVVSLDLALPTGEILRLGPVTEEEYEAKCRLPDREGEIYRTLRRIIRENREEIRERYPKVRRRSGGYPFDAFLDPMPWNMARIISSSEGTLGLVLELTVRLEPIPAASGLCLAHFADMGECLRAVAPIVARGASAVELIDGVIIRLARENSLTRETCRMVEGDPAGVLVVEAQGDSPGEVRDILRSITDDLKSRGMGYHLPVHVDPAEIDAIWEMRENSLGLMSTVRGPKKPVAFVEDASVPLEVLPEYVEEVVAVCEKYGRPVSLFGHASVGLVHVRPMHDLHEPAELELMKKIQAEVFEIVLKYRGSWSGEHGDGIVRAAYNRRFFGDRIYEGFVELKRAFDPGNLMNPGKIVDPPPMEENLRYGPGYRFLPVETLYHYRQSEGFHEAVEQCTGVGACRKTADGTMCPSYMATRDEVHSTRGRANTLRLAVTGQLGTRGLSSDELREVFDLCLACKACKNECPNNVDMARMKAEVIHHHHLEHGASLRDRLFSDPALLGALCSGWRAPIVNAVLGWMPTRIFMDRLLGIDRRRPFPRYARRTMRRWFRKHRRRSPASAAPAGETPRRVVLFDDTYMEYYQPSVGRAAVEVLEAAGFEVELVRVGDSQRPAISKGFLARAKKRGTAVLRRLEPYAKRGLPILVCEPSSASSLIDDLPDLADDEELGGTVAARVRMIDSFLAEEIRAGRCRLPWKNGASEPVKILFHGHCHQKALEGVDGSLSLLKGIPGAEVTETEAGCCGMAGAFGYEKEHFDISVKVAEDRLLDALRSAPEDALVVANGFSCRHQISDLSGRRAVHAIEAVRRFIDIDSGGAE